MTHDCDIYVTLFTVFNCSFTFVVSAAACVDQDTLSKEIFFF